MRATNAPKRLAADLAGKTAVLILAALLLAACVSASASASARPAKWAQPVPGAAIEKFFRLNDDIYRSAQPTRRGFEAARALGIASVINLRHDHSDAALVDGLGFNLVEIPMVARTFTEADVVKVLKAIQAAPKPVLVHCMHGADRTGVVSAMYRIVFENWTKEEALDELKRGGYGFHWYFFNIPSFIKKVDAAKVKDELKTP